MPRKRKARPLHETIAIVGYYANLDVSPADFEEIREVGRVFREFGLTTAADVRDAAEKRRRVDTIAEAVESTP